MNSGRILIIGAGSFSPEIDELARLLGFTETAFLDDAPASAYSSPVIGTTEEIERLRSQYDTAIVALGGNETRMKFHNQLKRCGYQVPILVHPSAYVSPDAELSVGCIIRAKCVVGRYAHLGEAVILNAGALVDHHVVIGDGCHILMGAVVRNMAKVEPLTRIPSNTVVE